MYILEEPITILIFVLDDQVEELELIKRKFSKEGIINCQYFSDYKEFIQQFNRGVDLAIIDYRLPDMKTGLDVVKTIIETNPFCHHIIVSGAAGPKDVVNFFRVGIKDFVLKDNDYLDELVAAVRRAMPQVVNTMRIAKKWWPEHEYVRH